MIEACEESGSYDLPLLRRASVGAHRQTSLVICLDSGCGNYDQLWLTTSLRGNSTGVLTVDVLTEGVHSGDASGIVPSSFRIVRQLLSRLEDEATGEIIARPLRQRSRPIAWRRRRSPRMCSATRLGTNFRSPTAPSR